ncbi:MAG: hypothetical protein IH623_15795 [Verrucomicrobia bacterium]|nr:hypothetical protein [Verrucomicrobiota bacterium]
MSDAAQDLPMEMHRLRYVVAVARTVNFSRVGGRPAKHKAGAEIVEDIPAGIRKRRMPMHVRRQAV